jgi:hypothetical protein
MPLEPSDDNNVGTGKSEGRNGLNAEAIISILIRLSRQYFQCFSLNVLCPFRPNVPCGCQDQDQGPGPFDSRVKDVPEVTRGGSHSLPELQRE